MASSLAEALARVSKDFEARFGGKKPICQQQALCKWPRCDCRVDIVYTLGYQNVKRQRLPRRRE